MERTRREIIASGAGALSLTALAGCTGDAGDNGGDDGAGGDDDGAGGDDDDHDDTDHLEIDTFEIVDRDHDEVVVYVHDDHWDGSFPQIEHGGYLSVGANVDDSHGDEIPLGEDEEYELRARVADGAEEGVLSFDYHGDHVHLIGESEGITDIVFQLWHDDHADYETPELTVQVVEDADDHDEGDHDGEVDELEIIDRSTDEVIAAAHDGHWHGELPEIPLDDYVSLGARFLDEHGEEIHIGSDEAYEFRARVADDSDEGVLSFDYHGDHVHLIGESEGDTEVVFQLYHDDHADYESPAIEAVVVVDN